MFLRIRTKNIFDTDRVYSLIRYKYEFVDIHVIGETQIDVKQFFFGQYTHETIEYLFDVIECSLYISNTTRD